MPAWRMAKGNRWLAAHGESLAAFDGRCIPGGCVAPRSNTPGILGRRALPAGRLARLGATPDFHHGLLGACPRHMNTLLGGRLRRQETRPTLVWPSRAKRDTGRPSGPYSEEHGITTRCGRG